MKRSLSTFVLSMAVAVSGHALEPELVSVKHSGLGGAGVAYPQDSLSIVLNPASSAQLCNRFDLGVHWKRYEHEFTIDETLPVPGVTHFKGRDRNIVQPDFAVNYWLGCDISVGLAFHNSFYSKYDAGQPIPLFGTTNLEHKLLFETITPVLAWRFCNCHTIGIGLPIYIGAYKNRGFENFESLLDEAGLGDAVTGNGWSHTTGWGINLGYLVHLMPCLDFGVSYQPRVSMKRFHGYRGFLPDLGKINVPEILRAGLAYKDDCWNLAFDVEHRAYSEEGFWGNSFVEDILGTASGLGLGWTNQTFFRLGGDYRWNDCWIFRAGVEQSTTHSHHTETLLGGIFGNAILTTASLGVTYNWDCNKEISAYYAHGFRRNLHSDESVLSEISSPTITGSAKLKNNTDYFGVSFGLSF